MKRVWLWVVPVVLVLFVIAGCGGPPTADDVKLEDLDDHKGTGGDYIQDDWDSGNIEADFFDAMDEIVLSLSDLEPETRGVTVDTVRRLIFEQLAKGPTTKAAYIEDISNNDSFGWRFTIDNETIDETTNDFVETGSLEILSFIMETKSGVEGDDMAGRLWLDLLMDGDLEATNFLYDDFNYNVVIDHGIIRVGSSGNAEISWSESGYTLSYSIYLDLKIGLSIHTTVTGRGGKILLNLRYNESFSGVITEDDFMHIYENQDFSAAPIANLSVDFEVYGTGSSTPEFSDTYDENDIVNLTENVIEAFEF